MNVFLIDNFDSFTFNLVDEFEKRGCAVEVWRNDVPAARALELALGMPAPRLLVLSPGPSSPEEAGCCLELIRLASGRIPLFGVCLGHQAIVTALGGSVGFAGEVVHGKPANVEHDGHGLLASLPSPFRAARYHSLAAHRLPEGLAAHAWTGSVVMSVEHERWPIFGVQFHPESILTPHGGVLIERVLRWAGEWTHA